MTYYNYLGQPMPETAREQSNILGTPAGDETIYAPAGDSSIAGDGGGDMLIGSSGDNTFFITDPADRVVEQPNGGIDTESGYMPITLAPNVENLVVHQDFNHGVGNSLDNLIITDGRAWLYGAAGNDVLVGATNTTTTFVEHRGEGSDVIYNWQGADQLQLTGYSFKTAADVRAAMTQKGADVVLQLAAGETLTFRNTTVGSSFQDKQFLLGLDTSKLGKLTFDDEFNSLSIYDPSHKTGTWSVDFGGNLKDQSAYSIPNNGEMELYTHEGFEGLGDHNLHLNPFSVANGVLSITAQPLPQADSTAAFGHSWSSGMLNTLNSFQQQYGYFEIRAQLPNVAGTWPAFWMVPAPYQPGQEADVMESIGLQPQQDYRFGWGAASSIDDHALKLNPNAWHTYGMLWTKTVVAFYMDGVEVAEGPTPSSWTNPMGMIVNMAMGGWGGAADPSQYPASLNIDYVRAYALADGSSIVDTLTPAAPVATLQDKTQPATTPAAQTLTFDDTGQALSSGKIVVLSHDPTAADVPQTGRAFLVWQSGGQVRAAEANHGYLDTPTVLMAGGVAGFTGAGTFLTDGRVVVSYMGTDAGQPAAYALIFDPATHKVETHELGPSSGQVSFVALDDGNFAASWHTSAGAIEARAYNAFAYDSKGWWGPVRDLPSDAAGVSAGGDLITSGGASFAVMPFAITAPDSVSISPATVTHAEGNSGVTSYTFTVTRSDTFWQRGTVAWKVTGIGSNPANAADFAGGWTPSGVLTFQGSDNTATITIKVVGDTTNEPDEQFRVSLFNPVGTTLGTATATGVITNDDTASTPPPAGQVLTSSGPGSVLTGGAGNDTLNASQGNDTLTGGAGADVFAFAKEPWSPIHITDFAVGTDRLDLSALFKAVGYTGADPVADHYIYFESDNAGGTVIRYDHDGTGPNPQWPNTIIDLEHLSPAGLTWAKLAGGGGSATPPPPSPTLSLTTTSVSHAEGNSGTTAFAYTVTRSGDASAAASVHWAVAGSGASPANAADFQGGVLPSGTLSFAAGVTSKVITVNVVGDATVEPNESFTVTLSGASGAALGTASATGLITNDDSSTSSGGKVLTSTAPGSVLTGGSGADTFNASQGNDTLTGGAGADVFAFPKEPWSPIHITDFTPGQDKLDVSALLKAAGYSGTNPIADHYFYVESDGAGGSVLRFDHDGTGSNPVWPNTIIDLEHLAPSQVSVSDWIIA